jgi:hypothetical protein
MSKNEVGSSRNIISGYWQSAIAIKTLCPSPRKIGYGEVRIIFERGAPYRVVYNFLVPVVKRAERPLVRRPAVGDHFADGNFSRRLVKLINTRRRAREPASFKPLISLPSRYTPPDCGLRSLPHSERSALLPHPFGPISAVIFPFLNRQSKPSSTGFFLSYPNRTPFIRIESFPYFTAFFAVILQFFTRFFVRFS